VPDAADERGFLDPDAAAILSCPTCRSPLEPAEGGGVRCETGHRFGEAAGGYLALAQAGAFVLDARTTSAHCAEVQEAMGERLYSSYLRPWLRTVGAERVLDAGCGTGSATAAMLADDLDAWGIDVGTLTDRWAEAGRRRDRFMVADVTRLPFADGVFDAVVSLGVIEHIGTLDGHLTLAPGYAAARQRYVDELVRVTRPGGRVMLACPNKRFPIDVQHGPNDAFTTAAGWRVRLFESAGLNLHRTWGEYHLATYREVRRLARGRQVRSLPLAGYFGFSVRQRPGLPASIVLAARLWVDRLPTRFRETPLNPYVLAEILVGDAR
jgi:SAM-dependent methyltransferase